MQISSSAQASPVTYITQENTGKSLNKGTTFNMNKHIVYNNLKLFFGLHLSLTNHSTQAYLSIQIIYLPENCAGSKL